MEKDFRRIDDSNYAGSTETIDGKFDDAELESAFNCFQFAFNKIHQFNGLAGNNNNYSPFEFINCFITLFRCFKNTIENAQNSLDIWRDRQRILSIGPFYMQNQYYQKLAPLRKRFVNIQFKLKSLIHAFMRYRSAPDFLESNCMQQHYHCPNLINGIPLFCPHQNEHCLNYQPFQIVTFKFYWALQQMAINFLRQSIVFSQQPPVILQSNRADVNAPRASRSRFDLSIEIFGASSWFSTIANQIDQNDQKIGEIRCILRRSKMDYTEENMINELEKAFMNLQPNNEDFVPSKCEKNPHFSIIPVDDNDEQSSLAVVAQFSKLGVCPGQEADRKNFRRQLDEIRYCFCFHICLKFSTDIVLNCWKVTLPFPIIYYSKKKVYQMTAEGMLERAFPNFAKNKNAEIAYGVDVAEILNLIFQKQIYPIDANSGFGLSTASKRYLLNNLEIKRDELIKLANFFKAPAKNCPSFNEWFFRLTEIFRNSPILIQLWKHGQVEAEQILRDNYQVRIMLIRFDENNSFQVGIIITFYSQNYVQHVCFDAKFLAYNNLSIKLLEIAEFNQIEWIYNFHGQPVDLKEALNLLQHEEEDYNDEELNFLKTSSNLAPGRKRKKSQKRTKKELKSHESE